jgi:hypothetical protein
VSVKTGVNPVHAFEPGLPPSKVQLVVIDRLLLHLLGQVANDCFVPRAARLHAEPLLLPQFRPSFVVVFLSLPLVGSPSAFRHAMTANREFDPPIR